MPVVGGEPAEVGDYPSTVSLMMDQGGGMWESGCTGTLVTPTVVVTAAHCLQDWYGSPLATNEVRIVYGYTDPASAPASERRTLASIHPNPDYDPYASTDSDGLGATMDIGVVLLSEPIANAVVTPILPASEVDSVLVAGAEVHVVGYGINNLNTWDSGILYKAVTPYIRHIPSEMLAGSPGNPDSCNGDSGGPAYVMVGGSLYLVGVTSRAWKKSQAMCGDGGIYTIASAYLPWLQGIVGDLDAGVVDVVTDVSLLDASDTCLPLTSACHPLTNEGCDGSSGEVCKVSAAGISCHEGPNEAQAGDVCDQTDRFCVAGFHCGASLRCERVCCSDADCPQGGPCTPISGSIGTLGTCGVEEVDAGQDAEPDAEPDAAGGAGGAGGAAGAGGSSGQAGSGGVAEAGADAQPTNPGSDEGDDDGCGCRTAGSSGSGVGWMLLVVGLGLGLVRRRSAV
jgi:MYXO-CTERM domain-containing protein